MIKSVLAVLLTAVSAASLHAQVKKIVLPIRVADQSFTLTGTKANANGYTFTGYVSTAVNGQFVDSAYEIITDTACAVTTINRYATGTAAQQQKLPATFSIPADYTNGYRPRIVSSFDGGIRHMNNSFVVQPVSFEYNAAKLRYDVQYANTDKKLDLKELYGDNITECSENCSYVDARGNYFTVFGKYLDNENDLNLKYYFFSFDGKANMRHADSATFAIKRYLYSKQIVMNNKNEFKGLLYFFHERPSLGRKLKDSTDSQYDMVYINEKGEKVFQNKFNFGNKKFALDVYAVSENQGSLDIIGYPYDDSTRYMQLNGKGDIINYVKFPYDKRALNKENPAINNAYDVINFEPAAIYTNGSNETFYLLREYAKKPAEFGKFENTFTYGRYLYLRVGADKNIKLLNFFADANTSVSAAGFTSNLIITAANEAHSHVLMLGRTGGQHHIWRMGRPALPLINSGIAAPYQVNFDRHSVLKADAQGYWLVGYSANEILVSRVVL
jgi:hypothetical protein